LKHRYRLSYAAVVAEVDTNLTWRLFCQLGISHAVPDESTVRKLTKGKAKAAVATLNDALLNRLAEERIISRQGRIRTDTTVLPANIAYPTDIGLLADGLRVLGRGLTKLKGLEQGAAAGLKRLGQQMEQARGKVKVELRQLAQRLKKKEAGVRQQATKAVLEITEQTVQQVRETLAGVLAPAAKKGTRSTKATQPQKQKAAAANERVQQAVTDSLSVLDRLIWQAQQVVSGNLHIKDRVVSVADREARPIRKGKLKTPTEFGRTVRVDQNQEGYITGYEVFVGSPGDAKQPKLAVEHHIAVFGGPPLQLAADRGMGCPTNDRKMAKLGVKDICLPQSGPLTEARKAVENDPTFVDLKNWRSGIEALISIMKRVLGWDRCRLVGTAGAEAWVDWSVLTYNLRRYGRANPKTAQAAA
jgi:transposase, IS5 family